MASLAQSTFCGLLLAQGIYDADAHRFAMRLTAPVEGLVLDACSVVPLTLACARPDVLGCHGICAIDCETRTSCRRPAEYDWMRTLSASIKAEATCRVKAVMRASTVFTRARP